MCGICGLIDIEGRPVSEQLIQNMCTALAHRGPDGQGTYFSSRTKPSVAFGHRRLKIIDLSEAGHQPMADEDGTLWLVFNGEIYNYQELRRDLEGRGHHLRSRTDAEVVLHLYEDYGEDCVSYLRGAFAFAIWDEKESKLLLVRDRLGQKPLIYYRDSQHLCFASEFASLMASGLVDKKINYPMIGLYLTFGYIPAPYSIYHNVYKLLPGHMAAFKENRLTIRRYWQLDYSKKINIDEQQALEEAKRLLNEAVKIRLASDVPLGVFLSGGLDSSMVVATMADLGQKAKTFSVGFKEGAYNELDYAAKVAQRFQTEHHEFIVTPKVAEVIPLLVERYGEPYADSSAVPSYYVAKQARQYVTVALNGDGGDESFIGYERYPAMYLAQLYSRIPKILRQKVLDKITAKLPDSVQFHNPWRRARRFFKGAQLPWQARYLRWVSMLSEDLKDEIYDEKFKHTFASEDSLDYLKPHLDQHSRLELLDTLLLTDISTNLPNDLLVKMDIAAMANSLEGRSPFLDHKIVEFMASLPVALRFKKLNKKYLLKKIAKDYLPADIIFRPKRGFGVPAGEWFRNDLKDFLQDNLLSATSAGRGYFKSAAIKNMLKQHMAKKKDYTFGLWTLLMLELWHKRFID